MHANRRSFTVKAFPRRGWEIGESVVGEKEQFVSVAGQAERRRHYEDHWESHSRSRHTRLSAGVRRPEVVNDQGEVGKVVGAPTARIMAV